ncbi:hypothetical protein F4780DRAFT_544190 [Xylariomycetidae sp. FL0641]|nr:hypothetical protein F4780DRAFT_544190 [Xylariomycetidae sp. FL0641]
MVSKRGQRWVLLCLMVTFSLVAAGPLVLHERREVSATTTPAPEETAPVSDGGDQSPTSSVDKATTTAEGSTAKESTSADMTELASSTIATTAAPSAINGNDDDGDNFFTNSTILAGQLPLKPQLTPGWGVAGAILLMTGFVYTLIGIKNTWLHTFFSTAYLSSLGVAVLIVYVMTPPVPVAIQGAYVVAGVITGMLLGGAATIFRELTEGLGCLLGGFCFAMWLLTLQAGGLLPATTAKVIFIAAFTLAGFALYFSRYTRPYAMIGLMSFAGATVTVLGIDCFSKAGLKEFWAYIWDLNGKLFPFGANTYPLTKGIKVEIAVIVVLTIAGTISQLKLWKVVQAHREKRDEERAEEQRRRDEEEEYIGRRIEEDNARERRQWETVYGDQPPASADGSDSGVGDVDNEKKGRPSRTTVTRVSTNDDGIEMAELPASDIAPSPGIPHAEMPQPCANGLMVGGQDQENRVTIRVAQDEVEEEKSRTEPTPQTNDEASTTSRGGIIRRASAISGHSSRDFPTSAGPEVTPLPFRIPDAQERDEDPEDDRSSFATFADEDGRSVITDKRLSKGSLANRLSVGSGHLLRSLSRGSAMSQGSKRGTREFESQRLRLHQGESTEDLVPPQQRYSLAESLAATIDKMSMDDGARDDLGGLEDRSVHSDPEQEIGGPEKQHSSKHRKHPDVRPFSTTETVATDILSPSVMDGEDSHAAAKPEATNEVANPIDTSGTEARSEGSKHPKSVAPSAASTQASLTKERLPSGLSRVAMSYRTNEWAKHLSRAEAPEVEELQLNVNPAQENMSRPEKEVPAPVDVNELQKTAENGTPVPIIKRSPLSLSTTPPKAAPMRHSLSRSSLSHSPQHHSNEESPQPGVVIEGQDADSLSAPENGATPNWAATNNGLRPNNLRKPSDMYIQSIQEEHGDESKSIRQSPPLEEGSDSAGTSGPSSPVEVNPRLASRTSIPGIVSYSSPQTLLGKREMFLRSKSQSTLLGAPIPEASQPSSRRSSQLDDSYQYQPASTLDIQDVDDLPLSQRKELMRQSSRLSIRSNSGNLRPSSTMNLAHIPRTSATPIPPVAADGTAFDSHQPQRRHELPSQARRNSQLANFRQSVAADLRSGTPVISSSNGRETPMFAASTNSLLGTLGTANGNHDVGRSIEHQRSMLLSQREQEAQRKELERWEKERNERAFEERMRRGDFVDAHREALRRMQGNVRN